MYKPAKINWAECKNYDIISIDKYKALIDINKARVLEGIEPLR